jgi:hypothetical protein
MKYTIITLFILASFLLYLCGCNNELATVDVKVIHDTLVVHDTLIKAVVRYDTVFSHKNNIQDVNTLNQY